MVNARTWLRAAAATTSLGLGLLAGPALADSIGPSTLVSQSMLVENQQSNVFQFTAPTAGTLSVQLSDVVWPAPLQNLDFSVDSATGVLGWVNSAGFLSLNVAQGGTYYADVSGQAASGLDLGLYSIQINFTPQGAVVPLPAAIGLLLGGLLVLAMLRMRWMRNESFMYGV
jgi:hypothetical protein